MDSPYRSNKVFCGSERTREQTCSTQLPLAHSLPLVQVPELFPPNGRGRQMPEMHLVSEGQGVGQFCAAPIRQNGSPTIITNWTSNLCCWADLTR